MAYTKSISRIVQILVVLLLLLITFCSTDGTSVDYLDKGKRHATNIAVDKTMPAPDASHQGNHTDHSNSGHNDSSHHGNHTQHHGSHGIHVASWNFAYVKPYLIVTIFLIVAAICKLAFHKAEFLSSIVPESCLLIILGTIVGAILRATVVEEIMLSTELFFLILLPPIILESAYSLHDRVFFDNLGTILLYAVIGTILNCFLLSITLYGLAEVGAMGRFSITLLQCLVFSSLIVAVDPVAVLAIFQEIGVNDVLYFLVFGESLLNDAVTVVLYNTMKTFNQMETIPASQVALGVAAFFTVSLGGLAIGILFGIFTSFLTKYTHSVKVVEPLAVFTLAYASYLVGELFHFSGIISIIGCGLVQAQYAFHNISMRSLTTITYFSKTMSTTCDCVIFMFLGLELVRDDHVWHTGFILWTLLFCLVFRFLVVYSLTFLANNVKRIRKVDMEEQFIMAYGGLRGAVAFSLVAMLTEVPHKQLFVTATLAVIIFTVFVQGTTIKPLVKLLRIKKSGKKVVSMYEEITSHVTDHMMAAVEEIVGRHGHNVVRELFDYYDGKYLKNWLQRNPQTRDEAIMQLYNKMATQLHYQNLAGAPDYSHSYDDGSQMDLYPCPPSPKPSPVLASDSRKPSMITPERLEAMVRNLDDSLEDMEETFIARMMEEGSSSLDHIHDKKRERCLSVPQPSVRRRPLRTMSQASQDRPGSGTSDGVSHSEPNVNIRRPSFIGALRRRLSTEVPEDINPQNVHKLFLKNNKMYRQRHDRNLLRDENNDLLHQLYEKRKRTVRMRAASIALSPAQSMTFDYDFSRSYQSEPNTPRRHTTLNIIREGELATDLGGQEEPSLKPKSAPYRAGHMTAKERIARRGKAATINCDASEIPSPNAPNNAEQTPLLNKPVSDATDLNDDNVFIADEVQNSKAVEGQNDKKALQNRRAHLIRQDDLRDRSTSPPVTPPVAGSTVQNVIPKGSTDTKLINVQSAKDVHSHGKKYEESAV